MRLFIFCPAIQLSAGSHIMTDGQSASPLGVKPLWDS